MPEQRKTSENGKPSAAGRGRHRAESASTGSRRPAIAGATAVAVAAVGAIVLADVEGNDSLDAAGATAESVGFELGGVNATPTGIASAVAKTAPADIAADAAASRGLARQLLATRVAAVEQQAAAAAATRLSALHKQCKFNPSIQRLPSSDPTQLRNAQTIVEVGQQMGLPVRAAVIALATAWQESNLVNMSGGDRDSVGLFQQRPSMGWGSYSQVHNPVYAAKQFYSALAAVPNWQTLPLTVAAQTVQASAFPWAYARWEQLADNLVGQLTGDTAATDLNCTPS